MDDGSWLCSENGIGSQRGWRPRIPPPHKLIAQEQDTVNVTREVSETDGDHLSHCV